MNKQISTSQTPTNIQEVLRLLSESPNQLERLSHGRSDQVLHAPLGSGERSLLETLVHLINCEARSSEAITLALLASEPLFTPIHPERDLGKLLRLEQFPFSDLLAYFKFRRTILLGVLTSLPEQKWSRVIRQEGKQRKESVYWQARTLALHELEHLQDLERKLDGKS